MIMPFTQSLVVHNFYVGEATDFSGVPTKMMTINGSLKLGIYNPATFFGMHVSSSPISLAFSEITVATGQVRFSFSTESTHKLFISKYPPPG